MTRKKAPKISKKFGTLLSEYTENGKTVKVYRDGNQIYFIKGGKIQPDMTMHIDDIDELILMLDSLIKIKEGESES